MRSFLSLAARTAIILAASLLVACNTTKGVIGPEIAIAPSIVKGSPAADLIAALGVPESIETIETEHDLISIWIYEHLDTKTELRSVETKDVPYFDPITGIERMIPEPVYSSHTSKSERSLRVYIVNDRVVGWKTDYKVELSIDE